MWVTKVCSPVGFQQCFLQDSFTVLAGSITSVFAGRIPSVFPAVLTGSIQCFLVGFLHMVYPESRPSVFTVSLAVELFPVIIFQQFSSIFGRYTQPHTTSRCPGSFPVPVQPYLPGKWGEIG